MPTNRDSLGQEPLYAFLLVLARVGGAADLRAAARNQGRARARARVALALAFTLALFRQLATVDPSDDVTVATLAGWALTRGRDRSGASESASPSRWKRSRWPRRSWACRPATHTPPRSTPTPRPIPASCWCSLN